MGEPWTNPDDKVVSYAYYALGQRSLLLDPDGGRFTAAYNSRNVLRTLDNPQGERTRLTDCVALRR